MTPTKTHHPKRPCRKYCCHGFPYPPFTPKPIEPVHHRSYFGFGLFIVLLAALCGLIFSSVDSDQAPACGTAPVNAYRSAGLWYSGDTAIGVVDPYNPSCFPKP